MTPVFYVAKSLAGNSVVSALKASFTEPSVENVVQLVDAGTRIVISEVVHDSLSPLLSLKLNGRASTLLRIPPGPQGGSLDHILFLTEKYQLCQIVCDASRRLSTRTLFSSETLKDRTGCTAEGGHVLLLDPGNRCVAAHLYQGLLKVLPMFSPARDSVSDFVPLATLESDANINDSKGKGKGVPRAPLEGELRSPFNVSLSQLSILSLVFLYCDAHPLLAILHQDIAGQRHLVTYFLVIDRSGVTLKSAMLGLSELDSGANILIPVPLSSGGGVLILGEQKIVYLSSSSQFKLPIRKTLFTTFTQQDPAGTRFLLTDHLGVLHLLTLRVELGSTKELSIKVLGETVQASSLVCLGNDMLFVGSHFADSQLMRLSADASHDSPTLTVLDAVPNLAPIIDFCLVDPEKQGQSQIVSCSGAHKDGSLRIIKNGIGIEEMGELSDVQGVTGIWSLRPTFDALHDSILVFSFVAETRFQKLQGGSLEEMEDMGGFISQEPTLCCANVLGNAFVQVTPSTVRLIKGSKDGSSYTVLHSWSPSPNANSHGTTSICCAAVNPTQVVVGLTLGLLVYLKLSGAKITQVGKRQLENEASCIDISPLGTGTMEAAFCALGTWTDVAVRLFALPSLEDVDVKQIEGDVVPRSILMAQMNSSVFLMTGLGDGHMASYNMDPSSGKLSVAKKFTIGAQQVRLHQLWQDGKVVVFACADHPTVIHADGDHLRFANVNIKELSYVSTFNTEETPNALAFVAKDALKIGSMESIQRLHIKTVPLGETPRRIAYQEQNRIFGLLTTKVLPSEEDELSSLKIVDDQTYEIIDSFSLEKYEVAQSLVSCDFSDKDNPVFVAGTAFVIPTEEEPSKGRLLVFKMNKQRKISLLYETDTKGCVYSLSAYEADKIVAGINARVQLFQWNTIDPQSPTLTSICSHHGYIVALSLTVCGAFIVVGDLMKSVSVLTFNSEEQKLKESYRDYASNWMTAVEAIDENLFIGSDNSFNLFALKKHVDEEEVHQLVEFAQFHNGELINRFRHGSLTLPSMDGNRPAEPVLVYGTVSGSVGVIAKVDEKYQVVLQKMEEVMGTRIESVGKLSHDRWRTFLNERGRQPLVSRNFIDGDLIESFPDLPTSEKEGIFSELKDYIESMEELHNLVDGLSRIH